MMKRMLTSYCTALIKLVFMPSGKREFFSIKGVCFYMDYHFGVLMA